MFPITRRRLLQSAFAIPFVWRHHSASARPNATLRHVSFGGDGMAFSDVNSLSGHAAFSLKAVAEVDESRLGKIKAKFPNATVYSDWRKLLDTEKEIDSANVSTPDHMHAPIGMSVLKRGLHLYGQKPLTQTIHEARAMTLAAAARPKQVTQMGIQIHSHEVHKTVVSAIQSGVIGKVKAVHSWSGKMWGDKNPRPAKTDFVPKTLAWDQWLGVANERPFINGYYHPGEWRKRLDFGTGTFGDMGCHILDPVYGSLALTAPTKVMSLSDGPNEDSWALETVVSFTFPQTAYTTESLDLTWYNGPKRPPADVMAMAGLTKWSDQGSVYIGTKGVMSSPYIAMPSIRMNDGSNGEFKKEKPGNHYYEFIDACLGTGSASAPFAYAGPLTEFVLLGCLATRFPKQQLDYDAKTMTIKNVEKANAFVRKSYRKGWEVEGL
jgi:predicted dehydrogenase